MARRRAFGTMAVLGVAICLAAGGASHAAAITPTTTPTPAPSTDQALADRVRAEAAAGSDLDAAASDRVTAMSLREKAASVVMGHIPTTDSAALTAYMAGTGIGGFILMGANVPGTEAELRALTAALTLDPALPPLIAIDQEGGDVSRLPWDDFASSVTLKDDPPEAAHLAFAARGALVQRAGIGVNFGIVADITDDPSAFIYRRTLGTGPDTGAERVAAAVSGEDAAALSTLKHFPGHGAAPGDSHTGIPTTEMSKADWTAGTALPFHAGIEAGAELLMFGHLVFSAVDAAPASLSAEWHRIARDELGFEGVSITDDLGMLQASGIAGYADPVANAVTALAAGNDMVLAVMFTTADSATQVIDGIVAAVEVGALPAERIDEAATRVMRLRLGVAAAGRGATPCAECVPAE